MSQRQMKPRQGCEFLPNVIICGALRPATLTRGRIAMRNHIRQFEEANVGCNSMTTCVYCGNTTFLRHTTVGMSEEAWAEETAKHKPDCEWVQTRGYPHSERAKAIRERVYEAERKARRDREPRVRKG